MWLYFWYLGRVTDRGVARGGCVGVLHPLAIRIWSVRLRGEEQERKKNERKRKKKKENKGSEENKERGKEKEKVEGGKGKRKDFPQFRKK